MNYRHIYHAGNFADVMKHVILVCLLQKLREKDKAFTVLDAFAGLGIYDLTSEESQKTKEFENGVGRVAQNNTPFHDDAFSAYLAIIQSLNRSDKLTSYPGSPYIIAQLLRAQDHLIATELHPQDYAMLKYNMSRENNCTIHHIDGYNAIKAFLPPRTSRGLILLDAAFEVKNEYLKIIEALKLISKRFLPGVVMIWYPIKDEVLIEQFYQDLNTTGYPEFLKIEFEIDEDINMNKCGVIIANPPHIKNEVDVLMQALCKNIYNDSARSSVSVFSIR